MGAEGADGRSARLGETSLLCGPPQADHLVVPGNCVVDGAHDPAVASLRAEVFLEANALGALDEQRDHTDLKCVRRGDDEMGAVVV